MERIAVYAFFAVLGIALVQIAVYFIKDFHGGMKDGRDFTDIFFQALIYFATFTPFLVLVSIALFGGVLVIFETWTLTSTEIVSFVLIFVLSGIVSFCVSIAKDRFGIGKTCCSPVLFLLCIGIEAVLVGAFLDWGIFTFHNGRSRPIFIPLFFR